jgi:hypothetical protein
MVYDFDEILGRGIIAARTGRSAEAIKYLRLAAKIDPDNPRAWLWLAAVDESVTQKRQYLEKAIKIDPNILVAKVLLDRINQKETAINQQVSDFVIFTCPYCGGKQRFDPDIHGMKCEYCHKVELLALENGFNAELSLDTALQENSGNWSVIAGQAVCSACGARMSILASRTTVRCPFCDSDIVSIQPATPDLITPTAIAPFQYHKGDMLKIIAESGGIQREKITRLLDAHEMTISSIYLPFWTFDGRVQIRCALEYRVPDTIYSRNERVIMKGEWPAEKSWFECDINDLLVYAGRSVSDEAIEQVAPFILESVLAYRPEILAGWQAELYQVALKDAVIVAHKRMCDIAFKRATSRMLFMDPTRMLKDDVLVLDQTYKLVLLPVLIARRTVGGKVYTTLVNGQTGKIAGHRTRR